jgi:nitrite reductase/ring-hydroxylating ferredoxin subunit
MAGGAGVSSREEVAQVGDVPDGELTTVEAGGRTIVLVNVGGDLYAIDDECTHQGCSLSDGTLDDAELECICHGSIFDVKTGEVVQGPAEEAAPTYPVHVEGGSVSVEID